MKLLTKEMRDWVIQKDQKLFYDFMHLFDSQNLLHLTWGYTDDVISPYPAPEYTHYILILINSEASSYTYQVHDT